MRTMTATEASRSFAALLDEVERGEQIVITRGGRRIAAIGPAPAANGGVLIDFVTDARVDVDFSHDLDAVRAASGEVAAQNGDPWADG